MEIRPDETILIAFPNPEIGQGVDTSLPMLLAEELGADFEKVETTQMPLELKRGDDGNITWKYLPQGSGGSYSIVSHWEGLRQVGALARHLLVAAAAAEWAVDTAEITVAKGVIRHDASGRETTFGAMAPAAAELDPPAEAPALKPREEFTLIGQPQKMRNARAIVTGKAVYGIDAELPGMLHAVMARCPYFDGTARSVDESAARAVPGVRDIVKVDRPPLDGPYTVQAEGYAVVADSVWAAMKGRDALVIDWDHGPMRMKQAPGLKTIAGTSLPARGRLSAMTAISTPLWLALR